MGALGPVLGTHLGHRTPGAAGASRAAPRGYRESASWPSRQPRWPRTGEGWPGSPGRERGMLSQEHPWPVFLRTQRETLEEKPLQGTGGAVTLWETRCRGEAGWLEAPEIQLTLSRRPQKVQAQQRSEPPGAHPPSQPLAPRRVEGPQGTAVSSAWSRTQAQLQTLLEGGAGQAGQRAGSECLRRADGGTGGAAPYSPPWAGRSTGAGASSPPRSWRGLPEEERARPPSPVTARAPGALTGLKSSVVRPR